MTKIVMQFSNYNLKTQWYLDTNTKCRVLARLIPNHDRVLLYYKILTLPSSSLQTYKNAIGMLYAHVTCCTFDSHQMLIKDFVILEGILKTCTFLRNDSNETECPFPSILNLGFPVILIHLKNRGLSENIVSFLKR